MRIICFVAAISVSERHRTSPLVLNGAPLDVIHLRGGGRRDDVQADVETIKNAIYVKVRKIQFIFPNAFLINVLS